MLAAQRFGSDTITLQSQNRKIQEILDEINNTPMPERRRDDPRSEEEVRRQAMNGRQWQQLFHYRLMLDGIFWCRAWTASTPWSSADDLLHLQSSASPLIMAVLAYDLEADRRNEADTLLKRLDDDAGVLGNERRFVKDIADYLKSSENDGDVPLFENSGSPDAKECGGRLLVSAFLTRLPSLAPETATADGKKIAEIVRPNGWLAATAWFDLLVGRLSIELGQKDYNGAAELLQKAVDDESPYTSAFYPQLRILQAGVATAAGSAGRAREFLDMVTVSQVANTGECATAAFAGTDEDCAFWRAWLGWASAVKGKSTADAKRMADQMSSSAATLAMKRLALSAQGGASSSGTK